MRRKSLWWFAGWIVVYYIGWRLWNDAPQWVGEMLLLLFILDSLREKPDHGNRNAA